MIQIFDLALPFFGLIGLGFLATRFFKHGEEGFLWLNTFIIWFALPALIFLVVAAAPFEKLVDWPFVTATTSVTAICFTAAFVAGRFLFRETVRTSAIQATTASYGNVGYMGLPLAVSFFGVEAAVPAALVFCCDCALQFVLTPALATSERQVGVEQNRAALALSVVRQVLTHPFIIATVLGALASYARWSPSGGLGTILEMLKVSAGPCALFALGATVGLRKFGGIGKELPLLVAIKLVLQPLLAFAILQLVPGLDPVWYHVALMMAGLPTASNAFIFARQYGAFIEGTSTAVIITTLISAVTLPLLIYVMKMNLV